MNMQELEKEKKKFFSLTDKAQIVAAGCECLNGLLKLYSQSKGKTAEKTVLMKDLIEIYYRVFSIMDIDYFPEIEKAVPFADLKPFALFLKDVHAKLAHEAQQKKMSRLVEYHLKKALKFHPMVGETLALANFYIENSEFRSALIAYQNYQGPFYSQLFYNMLYCLNRLCDFEGIKKELPFLKALIDEGDEYGMGLTLKWIGLDNQTVFKAAKNYQKKYEGRQDFTFEGSLLKERKIRLAYIGSNFIPHAQSYQFGTSFFKDHGEKFEIFIYSLKGDGTSGSEVVIKSQVDHYANVGDLNAGALVQKIREDQIDIIVNCNGFADDVRPYVILCRRVAPIQIEYLGYPGTSGSTYMDYYIGDPVSTPIDALGPYFTEKLILMPHTYQVTEHREIYPWLPVEKLTPKETRETILRIIEGKWRPNFIKFLIQEITEGVRNVYHHLETGDHHLFSLQDQIVFLQEKLKSGSIEGPYLQNLQRCMELKDILSRIVQGDPEAEKEIYPIYIDDMFPPDQWVDGRFIFCSLNNHAKLSLKDILCWNEILQKVKNSVLILLMLSSSEAEENLIKWFDPEIRERIYFIGNAPKLLHMQRLRGINLILDSFYYGAHTTAGDAIWAQVPVATCLGESMESRVCGSMLTAAGLKDLIAEDRQGYIDFAVRCATDPVYYKEILEKMKGARNSPLFDRELYVKNLTAGYRRAWKIFCEGKRPENIKILYH